MNAGNHRYASGSSVRIGAKTHLIPWVPEVFSRNFSVCVLGLSNTCQLAVDESPRRTQEKTSGIQGIRSDIEKYVNMIYALGSAPVNFDL